MQQHPHTTITIDRMTVANEVYMRAWLLQRLVSLQSRSISFSNILITESSNVMPFQWANLNTLNLLSIMID